MTDLSELPWTECELPDFNGRKVHAAEAVSGNFAYIAAEDYYTLAIQCEKWPGRWEYRRCTVDEIEQIAEMCRAVERFIESHTGPMSA